MTIPQELVNLRSEATGLRKKFATTFRAWLSQKEKNQRLENEIADFKQKEKQWGQERKEFQKDIKDLQGKVDSLTATNSKYQGMIFKSSLPKIPDKPLATKKRGAQTGHRGASRRKPTTIDVQKDVHLTHCPDCDHPVDQTASTYERVVTDIPIVTTVTTSYIIQRQWCINCKKEVIGIPDGTLSGLRFGVHFLSWLLLQKYRMRTPLAKIKELALATYQLEITEGGIQKLLAKLKQSLGPNYSQILKEIKKAKVKHADETSWRIEGKNSWCWLFVTQKSAYYTIEETRGGGVAKKILEGSPPESVLVRDDYAGYASIDARHQSCWSHLLRTSHELAVLPNASKEIVNLHRELKNMFNELQEIVSGSFIKKHRQASYAHYTKKLETIAGRNYLCQDSKKVQTRIKNQHTNLLTALIFEHVPLTNNYAERQIRPMTVTRKISGGSRSNEGAAIHAVLMSITQTLSLKKKNILESLPKLLSLPAHSYTVVLGKGE